MQILPVSLFPTTLNLSIFYLLVYVYIKVDRKQPSCAAQGYSINIQFYTERILG